MGGGPSKEFDYKAQLLADHKAQSCFAEGTKDGDNFTACLRALESKDGFPGFLPMGDDEKNEIDNCIKGMESSVRKYPKRSCLGWRPYVDGEDGKQTRGDFRYQNYEDTYAEMVSCGKGLADLVQADAANIGIYGKNRPEWAISAFGSYTQRFRSVALYDTLGQEAVEYILGHAELLAICCEKNKLDNLFKSVENAGNLPLKFIIQWDYQEKFGNKQEAIDPADIEKAKEIGVTLVGLSEVIAKGRESTREVQTPEPEDIAYIMYTSGTTGLPKGVLLSHGNFASTVASVFRWMAPVIGTKAEQRHVSFLPLAHSFEALMHQVLIIFGGIIAYQQGNIKLLTADWLAIRPTILAGVPRVYQKIYDKVMAGVADGSCVKQWVVGMALKNGTNKVRNGEKSPYWDKKVWSAVRAKVGWDDVRMIVSGAAPLPSYLGEFLKIMSGQSVVQGYGMTETTALGTKSNVDDPTVGHCGCPFDNIEVRLESCPEMNYLVTDTIEVDGQTFPAPRGEVQMRGPSIFQGYHKAPDKTAETITKDGWLLSGDIGRINPNGTLSIIDRKKNIFKTAFGEYIAAEKIEGVYAKAPQIGQIFLYGNSFKTRIMAVVVPDGSFMKKSMVEAGVWEETGGKEDTPGTLGFATKFNEHVTKNMDHVKGAIIAGMRAEEAGLKKIERITDIHVEGEIDDMLQGFNVANECLTPTFKLRRKQLLDKYRDQFKAMYVTCGEPPKGDENW